MRGRNPGNQSMRNRAGFTLIEILIAILLLVVALVGMASVTTMVIKGNAFSRTTTTATTLARDKMESIKNTSYAALAAGQSTDYATVGGTVQTSSSGAYFSRTSTVTADAPAANMKTVVVTVNWPQPNPTFNVTLNTIMAAGD